MFKQRYSPVITLSLLKPAPGCCRPLIVGPQTGRRRHGNRGDSDESRSVLWSGQDIANALHFFFPGFLFVAPVDDDGKQSSQSTRNGSRFLSGKFRGPVARKPTRPMQCRLRLLEPAPGDLMQQSHATDASAARVAVRVVAYVRRAIVNKLGCSAKVQVFESERPIPTGSSGWPGRRVIHGGRPRSVQVGW